jgi:uncharacterized membrane protein YoaK (UPF0700 family)
MVRYSRSSIALAAALSWLAGFVDAIGFLHLGGFFVSFMSGNSTRLAVAVSDQDWAQAAKAGGIILVFVIGVVVGSFCGHLARQQRRLAVLSLQTCLLIGAAALYQFGFGLAGTIMLVLAMGAENTVFLRDGEVSIGLTYMTGTLVKMGQRLAAAMLGGRELAWFPYFALWCALGSGAIVGGFSFARFGLGGLWIAAALAACLAIVAGVMGPQEN